MQDLADHHVEQPVAAANFLLDSFSEEDKSKMKVALADKRTLDSLVKAAAEQAAAAQGGHKKTEAEVTGDRWAVSEAVEKHCTAGTSVLPVYLLPLAV